MKPITATDQAGNKVEPLVRRDFRVDIKGKDSIAPAVLLESVYPVPNTIISIVDLTQIQFIASDSSSGIDDIWIEING